MKKRKTIGFLVDEIDGNYQTFLWLKIKEAAEKFDCNLIVYEGRTINPVLDVEKQHRIMYEFVSDNRLDGLIINGASISSRIAKSEFIKFCNKFTNIPQICLGQTLVGATSLMIDNKRGMKSLLWHLINHHNYRKILFIKGPSSNEEAKERFAGYLEVLEENGISFNEGIVFEGDFESQSGHDIMKEIISKDIEYDAIVCSNDDMALGAIKCLHEMAKQGRANSDKKLVICGFDDSINSGLVNPSLTTVRPPIEEICNSAVELLLKKIEGEKIRDVISFPAVIVIRESCGCDYNCTINKVSDSYLRFTHGYRIHENLQTYSLEQLFDSISASLPLCDIRSCFISKYLGNSIIYDENSFLSSKFKLPEKSELIYAYYNNKRLYVDEDIRFFKTQDMVPLSFNPEERRITYLANPLFFNNEHFGFVVFEVENEDVINFEPLRGQISNTLKGALMVLERTKMEKSLLESERLASLGQLIGGISHNLMTPIMSIAGVCAGLDDLIKEYKESVSDSTVSIEDHYEIASEMSVWIKNLKEYNSYMCELIKTVKNQAIKLNAHVEEDFPIGELVKQVKFMTKNNIRYKNHSINYILNVDLGILLKGDMANLVQVFDNLIKNAIQSYESVQDEKNAVEFHVNKYDDLITFIIRDYGKGISEDIINKIFKHMVTTKGKNGTGLSLLMSYSTIKGKFKGEMWFESNKNEGTSFFIAIPIYNKS